jgi:eukaryotic-like serine/threonine-protein kinase
MITTHDGPDDGERTDEAVAWAAALRFQREWSHCVRLDDYLDELPDGSNARRIASVHLAQIDLEFRWRNGQKVRAGEYFPRVFRDRGDDRVAAMELIESEYQYRLDHLQRERRRLLVEREDLRTESDCLTIEAFQRQYPAYGDDLAGRLRRRFPTPPSAEPCERFQVLNEYEVGGSGVISLARDLELQRDVALKKIKEQLRDDPEIRRRFVLEAETTGNLEHPGIVPVYGLGYDRDGNPFYAMRFIQGQSFAREIRQFHAANQQSNRAPGERRLELHKLLRRLLDVCNTVSYAHSRGLVHRDLKPDNVMLGPYGETLVLDWGLVKVVGQADTSRPRGCDGNPAGALSVANGTVMGTVVGTVVYMSPEQAQGEVETIGPASDVYSLGAILYYLLTGEEPFAGKQAEVLEKVKRGDFQPPSTGDHRVPRGLAAICEMAMKLQRADRYATVRAMADDIEHWLADEPVSTWREPLPVRARRWMSRHRGAVTTGAVATLLVLVALITILALQRQSNRRLAARNEQLRQARAHAERHAALALSAIDKFRQVVQENIDVQNRPDLKALRRELLQKPLEFYQLLREDLKRSKNDDPDAHVRLAKATFNLATIVTEIGSIQSAIENFEETIANVDASMHRRSSDPGAQVLLARAEEELGMLRHTEGQDDPARNHLARAKDVFQKLVDGDRSENSYQEDLARTLDKLGLTESKSNPKGSLAYFEQGISIQRGLVEKHPPNVASLQTALARSLNHLGMLHRNANRHAQAETCYNEAIETLESVAKEHPENATYRANLATAHFNLGNALLEMHGKEAMPSFERAKDLLKEIVRKQPSVSSYRARLAGALGNIALVQLSNLRPAQAVTSLEQVRDMQEELIRDDPTLLKHQLDLIVTYTNLGLAWNDLMRPEKLVECVQRLLALQRDLLRQQPHDNELRDKLAINCTTLARACNKFARFEEASTALEWAADQRRMLLRRNPVAEGARTDLLFVLSLLADCKRKMNRPEDLARLAKELGDVGANSPEGLYLCARGLAWCDSCQGAAGTGLSSPQEHGRRPYGEKAIEILAESIRKGFNDFNRLRNDRAFASLRSRPKFLRLIGDQALPPDVFAR